MNISSWYYLGGNLCPFKIFDLSGTWPLVWEIWTYMRTSTRMGSSMECGKVDLGQGLKCQKYQQWVGSEVEQLYMIWWYGFQCTLFNASQFLCPIIQVWRHTCLSISSSTGKFKLVENGEKAVDKVDSTIIEWMNDIPKKVCIGPMTWPYHSLILFYFTGNHFYSWMLLQKHRKLVHVNVWVSYRCPSVQQGTVWPGNVWCDNLQVKKNKSI